MQCCIETTLTGTGACNFSKNWKFVLRDKKNRGEEKLSPMHPPLPVFGAAGHKTADRRVTFRRHFVPNRTKKFRHRNTMSRFRRAGIREIRAGILQGYNALL